MAVIVTFQQFKVYKHLVCAVSSRQFGSIKEKGKVFPKNLNEFASALHISPKQVVFTKQMHGKDVIEVRNLEKQVIGEADGLITNKKKIFIGIATADCLPLVFYDPEKEIVGVAHAGFKGLLAGILEEMIQKFREKGSDPKDILIGIGPAIQSCCYNVPKERIEMFTKKFPKAKNIYREDNSVYYLDLANVAKFILSQKGVLEDNIEDSGICTSDVNDLFFSYRKDSDETFGEFATIIGML